MVAKQQDPVVPDWTQLQLQDSWVDSLDFRKLDSWKTILGKRKPVVLPKHIPGRDAIPTYVLQEFHNLPNGNYSNRLTSGYIRGFEVAMLGMVQPVRVWMAEQLAVAGSNALLDIGTTSGKTAETIRRNGMSDAWGVDPSPYLLKHAASRYPKVNFIQATAEDLPFPDQRFDGVSLCFVLHEIPPKFIARALSELHRVMKPGAKLCIAEPSAIQLEPFEYRDVFTLYGWKKIYFRKLANHVHEPFIPAWHKLDKKLVFEKTGFEVTQDLPGMPINRWLLTIT